MTGSALTLWSLCQEVQTICCRDIRITSPRGVTDGIIYCALQQIVTHARSGCAKGCRVTECPCTVTALRATIFMCWRMPMTRLRSAASCMLASKPVSVPRELSHLTCRVEKVERVVTVSHVRGDHDVQERLLTRRTDLFGMDGRTDGPESARDLRGRKNLLLKTGLDDRPTTFNI